MAAVPMYARRDGLSPSEWFDTFGGKCCECKTTIPDVRVLECPFCGSLEEQYNRSREVSDAFKLLKSDAIGPEESFGDTPQSSQKLSRTLVLKCMRDIQPKDVSWLWEGWLPLGKLVAFDGAPGIGKTTIALDLIARATRGIKMPGSDTRTSPITVLIAGVEDGWEDTIRPRLDAATADLDRIHTVRVSHDGTFTIPDDVHLLEEKINDSGAKWVHFDSIMGVLSEDVRTNSDHDVRRALGSLKDMAERLGVLITFIRHPRKAGAATAVDAGGGSIAFSGMARVVLFAGFDPSDTTEDLNARRRVLAVGKSNLSRLPSSRTFQLANAPNGRPCVAWGDASPITADDLASAPMRLRTGGPDRKAEATTKQTVAEQWLSDWLESGAPVSCDELKARARESQLKWRTVERAAAELGVSKKRGNVGEPSTWYLARVAPVVAPSRPANDEIGATAISQEMLDFPVAPSSRQGGASGATHEIDRRAPVAPNAAYIPELGATDGATVGRADT